MTQVQVLEITLLDQTVGYLLGYSPGRNVLVFDQNFAQTPDRATFSIVTHPKFPKAQDLLAQNWVTNQRLHPILSNLLPEGALRDYVAQGLKTHKDNEFPIMAHLGRDLPGALVASPVNPEDIPTYVLSSNQDAQPTAIPTEIFPDKFSLAGVQMKFSMRAQQDNRMTLSGAGELGDWIIKTPSTQHQYVPQNEFSSMALAAMVGVDVPEHKLVPLEHLEGLPPINLPNETQAYAIKRFDRAGQQRIHMEDFAQVLVKYPEQKYRSANYRQIGQVLNQYSGNALEDIQQMARRLLVNILLGNGDTHLKNWSLLYADGWTPRLSPAYDIVMTKAYMPHEREYALNLTRGQSKDWYAATMADFEGWATKVKVPWRAVRGHLADVMDKARTLWPHELKNLPMHEPHKDILRAHWAELLDDFKLI